MGREIPVDHFSIRNSTGLHKLKLEVLSKHVSVPNVQYMFKNLMCMFAYLKTPVVTIFPGGSQKLDWTQNFEPHCN